MFMPKPTSHLRIRVVAGATGLACAASLLGSAPVQAFGHGHGGRLHIQGGNSSDHNGVYGGGFGRGFNGGNHNSRNTDSGGFGYNAGVFGQGAYYPYNSSRCLVRADGGDGPRIVRVC